MIQKRKIKYCVGIDYSIQSPSICVFDMEKEFKFSNCEIFYHTENLKLARNYKNISSEFSKRAKTITFESNIERFVSLANWAISKVPDDSVVLMEDYAYAAKGRVFTIAENTMCLKLRLYQSAKRGVQVHLIDPNSVKKLTTDKGNATKELMYESFKPLFEENLELILGVKPGDSPLSDIVDSFFICKIIYEKQLQLIQENDTLKE